MVLTFFYLSGSPFSWKVWLALEHKALAYELKRLSADAGDLKAPQYLAINPHGKAPAIVVDGFVLYESSAIVEFLEDRFPHQGRPLWPQDAEQRAVGRRIAAEVDAYLYPPLRCCVEELLLRREGVPDKGALTRARDAITQTLALFAGAVGGPFLLGSEPCAADFALYPLTAILGRLDLRHPARRFSDLLPRELIQWRARVEALPYFERTLPPHWKS